MLKKEIKSIDNKISVDGIEKFYTNDSSLYNLSYKLYSNPHNRGTILFLYGFGGNLLMATLLEPYITKDYSLLLVDYPGHCYSPPSIPFSLEKLNKSIDALLSKLGIDSCLLVGYSFGGIIALDFINRYKNRVKKLLLLNTVPNFCPNIFKRWFYELFEIMLNLNYKFFMNYIAIPILTDSHFNKELLKTSREVFAYSDPDSVKDNFNKIIYLDYSKELENIECETFLVSCQLDMVTTTKAMRKYGKRIKNSQFLTIKGYGHLILASGPEIVGKIIVECL